MSDPDEPDPINPFAGLPMFGDLARMFQSQGPLNWDIAKQFAVASATGGAAEANVDPAARVAIEQLARIAELHVQHATGLELAVGGAPPRIECVTRSMWAQRTLEAYRPLMQQLATSLGQKPPAPSDDQPTDPMFAMMAGLSQMIGPSMLAMALGSMVGHLATRAFGQYDLPIPREGAQLLIVPSTIDEFAAEWELDVAELRMWVCLQELTGHAVLNVPHLRDELTGLVSRHVAGFRPDPEAIADKLGNLEFGDADALRSVQQAFGDPEVLLGAVQSPEQLAQLPRIDALVSVVVGYVDHAVDRAATAVIGSGSRIAEAVRRRRVEASPEDVFVERLFGLSLTRRQVDRGRAFVAGVIERAGDDGLAQLFSSASALPTPNEVDAPGLWLARLEFDAGAS